MLSVGVGVCARYSARRFLLSQSAPERRKWVVPRKELRPVSKETGRFLFGFAPKKEK